MVGRSLGLVMSHRVVWPSAIGTIATMASQNAIRGERIDWTQCEWVYPIRICIDQSPVSSIRLSLLDETVVVVVKLTGLDALATCLWSVCDDQCRSGEHCSMHCSMRDHDRGWNVT